MGVPGKERDLFSVKPFLDKSQNKKRKLKSSSKGELSLKKLRVEHKRLADVQHVPLLYENITEGQTILGCIQEVRDYELRISLPHLLSGTVPLTRISKAYTELLKKMADGDDQDEEVKALQDLYWPGQYVITSVTSIEDMGTWKKVNLSLMPQDVNSSLNAPLLEVGYVLPCAVSSVEDKGFIMDTGIASIRGAFLPHTAAQGADIVGVGSVLRCMVTKIKGDQEKGHWNVVLSADPEALSDATLPITSTTNMSLMIPGTAVDTAISKVEDFGLNVILAEYDGVVNRIHLKNPFDIIQQYQEGMQVRARVLYTSSMNKVVHFTLQKNIFSGGSNERFLLDFKEGEIIQNAVVYEARTVGLSVKLNKNNRGYCPWNRLTDGNRPPKQMKKIFPVGRKLICRILKYSYMDQMFIVSLQKSVLEQQLLSYNEVEVGAQVKATVKSYNDHGAEVAISKTVTGHISFMMLTDTQIKNPEKKYPIGSVLNCRVLYVMPEKKILKLTSKKLLVNSPYPIISEYDPSLVGTMSEGCIVRINQSGLVVALYNDVKGFVPKSLSTSRKVTTLDALFSLGQVVKFCITKVVPEKRNMTLTLRIDGDLVPGEKKPRTKIVDMRQKVSGVIKEIQEKVIIVTLTKEGVDAQLPVNHLLDDISKCGIVKALLREGDEVKDAVVFSIEEEIITLSLKASVHNWINISTPEQQGGFVRSATYPAVVLKVYTYGALIKIPVGEGGQQHIIRSKKLGDESQHIDCRSVGLHPGQTLWVESEGLNSKGHQVLSCLHTRNVQRKAAQHSIQPLYSCILNLKMVKDLIMRRGSSIDRQLAKLQIGRKLGVTVTKVKDSGLQVKLNKSQIQGFIPNDHRGPYTNVVVGQKLYASVINVKFEDKSVDLSSLPIVVKELQTSNTPKVAAGRRAKCKILQVQENFIKVMLISRDVGLVTYLPPLENELNIETKHINYKVGEEHRVNIVHVDGDIVLGVLRKFECKEKEHKLLSDGPSWQLSENASETKEAVEDIESDVEEVAEKYASLLVDYKKAKRREEIENQWKAQAAKKIKKEKEAETTDEEEGTKKKGKKNKKAVETTDIAEEEEKTVKKKVKKNMKATETTVTTNKVEKTEKKKGKKRKKDAETIENEEECDMDTETTKKKEGTEKKKKKKCKEDTENIEIKEEVKSDSDIEAAGEADLRGFGSASKKQCLSVGTGFVWDVPDSFADKGQSSESEEEEEDEAKKKKTKKMTKAEREAMAKQEEQRLHELEHARLDKDRLPQTAMDYEELLQTSPNSSAIWIQFISFHLESAEVEKAKAIARRALQVINMREEQERLNIWTVILRLEVLYGTADSVEASYREALATNDEQKVHLAMATAYAENDKIKEASKIYYIMTKKYGQVLDVWIKAGIFFFRNKKFDEARNYMDRALVALEKKNHVELINRFGQLEFKFGEAERGRTMFESLLSNYPKRTDIWNVYVDLLTKNEDIEGARTILERMTGLKLKIRKMRGIFKKFLDFEKTHGTPQRVEAVKKQVEDFVAAAISRE